MSKKTSAAHITAVIFQDSIFPFLNKRRRGKRRHVGS